MDARAKILDAAAQIAAEEGVRHLTIDNVAKMACLSKGGVFYHFKNKEELLSAMIDRIIDQFEENCEARCKAGMPFQEAMLDSSFDPTPEQNQRISALVAAVTYDRNILSNFQSRYEDWIKRMVDNGIPYGKAILASSAIDGYYAAKVFGFIADADEAGKTLKEQLRCYLQPSPREWLYGAFVNALQQMKSEEANAAQRPLAGSLT